MSKLIRTIVAAAALATCNLASAEIILTFEGLGSQASILDFYNGGTDSMGNTGVNYGIAFGNNALALTESDPISNVALAPSPETVMFFLTGSAILNYAAGFDAGFSFWYSTTNFTGEVQVYDQVNATGNLLGTINLAALGVGPSPGNPFSNWAVGALSFGGLARSINFGGTVNQVAFDNITLGSINPNLVPEPGPLALLGIGALGLAAVRRRKARK